MTLEEQYRIDTLTINARYPVGSSGRRQARANLWRKYLAEVFIRDGNNQIIYDLQREVVRNFSNTLIRYIRSEISEAAYLKDRVDASFKFYAEELANLGLVDKRFSNAWIEQKAIESRDEEKTSLPSDLSKVTEEELKALCEVAKSTVKQVFSDFHTAFGIGRLKDDPTIFGEALEPSSEALQLKR